MAPKKHTHKYHVVEINCNPAWACALGDCSHHLPENVKNTINGKLSICWNCDKEFHLDDRALKLDMPICVTCAIGNNEIVNKLLDPLTNILNKHLTNSNKCIDCGESCNNDYCDLCKDFHKGDD